MQIKELEDGIWEINFNGKPLYINKETGKISKEFDKEYLLDKRYNPVVKRKPHFTLFVIDTTFNCTLSCKYCYNEFYTKRERKGIDRETMKLILDRIFDYLEYKNNLRAIIEFHGGEPLLYKDTIKFACKYVEQNDLENFIKFRIQTNGTLIDLDAIKIFKKYNFSVGISIDGTERYHNKTRVFPNGEGSFKRVMKGVKLMNQHGISHGVLTTVTKYNARYFDEIMNFFLTFTRSIATNFVWGRKELEASEDDIKIFAHKTTLEILRNFYMKRTQIKFRELEHALVHLFTPIRWNCGSSPCIGATNYVSIDYKGNVYPCNKIDVEAFKLGNLYDKELKDMENAPIAKEYRKRFWKKIKQCKECILGAICQGKCPAEAYFEHGTIHAPSSACKQQKAYYFKIMELYAKRIISDDFVKIIISKYIKPNRGQNI